MLFEFKDEDNFTTYDLYEGFIKGNMYPSIYSEYKNYKPQKLNAKNEQELLLLKIMMLDFSINDLNLYLAIHPDCKKTYDLFKEYNKEYKKLKKEYEEKYQVLDINDDTFGKYTWDSEPYPWEVQHV